MATFSMNTTNATNHTGIDCGFDTGSSCLGGLDAVVVAIYFVILLVIAFWPTVSALFKRLRNGPAPPNHEPAVEVNPSDFFLASREMGAWAVAASLFSSNIGSEHFIGLAGEGANSGLAVSGFEWSAGVMLMILGWVFFPAYFHTSVMTTPEWVQQRFGTRRIRMTISVISLLLYCFTKISVTLYAGGVILKALLGWDLYLSCAVLICATGTYTAVGGLRVVVYTEVFQTVALVIGGLLMTTFAYTKVGGWHGLENDYDIPQSYFHVFRPSTDNDYPWTGMVFGIFPASMWYWCTDQVIVQRVLSARTERDGRLGTIVAALLKVSVPFMMVVPGIVCKALYSEALVEHGHDVAYPLLVAKILPPGVVGFVTASMLAALMSSLASVFNSSSTLFTIEIWQVARPQASDRELVMVGRLAVVLSCIVGLVWLPIVGDNDQLFVFIQSVSNYLSPPIFTLFMLALFVENAERYERCAFVALLVGFTLGVARLVCHTVYHDTDGGTDFTQMNYLHFGLLSAVITATVFLALAKAQGYSEKVAGGSTQQRLLLQSSSATPSPTGSRTSTGSATESSTADGTAQPSASILVAPPMETAEHDVERSAPAGLAASAKTPLHGGRATPSINDADTMETKAAESKKITGVANLFAHIKGEARDDWKHCALTGVVLVATLAVYIGYA